MHEVVYTKQLSAPLPGLLILFQLKILKLPCVDFFSLRFKGVKKGGVTENTSYYIFTQCPDGAFEAFPVNNWYNFTPIAKHRTLTAEEAEEEWER